MNLKLQTYVKSGGFTSCGMKMHLSTVLEQHPLLSQNVNSHHNINIFRVNYLCLLFCTNASTRILEQRHLEAENNFNIYSSSVKQQIHHFESLMWAIIMHNEVHFIFVHRKQINFKHWCCSVVS